MNNTSINIFGIVVQLVRAPPCHGGSCGFEPRQSRLTTSSFQRTRSVIDASIPPADHLLTDASEKDFEGASEYLFKRVVNIVLQYLNII